MKDIDFDELDKAVSSLLGGVEKQPTSEGNTSALPVVSAPADTTLDTQNQADDTVRIPEVQSSGEKKAETKSAYTHSQANLVEKRGKGRFMDVVHPSSDMRNLQKPSVARTAPDVLPTEPHKESEPDTARDISSDSLTKDQPEFGAMTKPEPAGFAAEPLASGDEDKHNQPDPLEFQGFSDDEASSRNEDSEDRSAGSDDGEVETTDELDRIASDLAGIDSLLSSRDQDSPRETPFVSATDAFEKRPLGAFSANQSEVGANDSLDTQEQASSASAEVGLHAEDSTSYDQASQAQEHQFSDELESADKTTLGTALNAMVSGEGTTDAQSSKPEVTEDAELQTVVEPDTTPEELREELVSIEAAEVTTANPASTISATGSIPQQYTTKVTPQHAESTAVFDTDQYHQPLKHAPKKKSGIGVVILIIALVVIGAGGGAAFYFFDPFHLFS